MQLHQCTCYNSVLRSFWVREVECRVPGFKRCIACLKRPAIICAKATLSSDSGDRASNSAVAPFISPLARYVFPGILDIVWRGLSLWKTELHTSIALFQLRELLSTSKESFESSFGISVDASCCYRRLKYVNGLSVGYMLFQVLC